MKRLAVLVFVFQVLVANAQQDPIYTYSFNNPVMVNPAFTGMTNALEGSIIFRDQWSGDMPGAPRNLAFNLHSAIAKNKVGVGLSIANDKLGVTDYTYVNANYAYIIQLNSGYLSFGMNAGIVQVKNDFAELEVKDDGDVFDGSEQSVKPNFGAGVVYQNHKLTLGLSAPRILDIRESVMDSEFQELGKIFTFLGSYDFDISANVKLRPSVLVRLPEKGRPEIDYRLDGIINENFRLGVFTRDMDYFGLAAGVMISDKYKFNYQYELPVGDIPSQFNAHEVMLSLRIKALDEHFFSQWF